MPVGEPTAAVPAVEANDAKAPDDAAEPSGESAPDDGEPTVVRRRAVPDSPGAGVAEAVEAGSLASPGGGGDGVVLFDQETEPEGGSPIGARYRRR
jgi:hypothetical protein